MEEDAMKSKPKARMNLVKVDWDQPRIDVYVASTNQKVKMLKEESHGKKIAPTEGQQTKWEKKNIVHRSVPKELLQGMHKLEYKPLKIQKHYTNMELVNLSFQHNGPEGETLMNLTKEKLICQDVIKKYKSFKSLKISQLMSKQVSTWNQPSYNQKG